MPFLDSNYTRASLKLAVPVMITQLGQVSVNLFDNMIVGKLLGADALASVSLGNAVFFTFFVFAMGFSYAIPPLVSEADAQNNHQRISRIFQHGFVINLTIGLILLVLMLLGMPLLYHMGQPKSILPDTIGFLSIMAFSIIPFVVFQTYREVSEGLSFTIGVTKATIAGNVLNIFLNFVLIGGELGFPKMGVEGSATGTLISRIFMLILLYRVMLKEPKTHSYIKAFHLKIKDLSGKIFKEMLTLGFPTALQLLFEVTAFAGAAFICGLAGAEDIAAHQIAISMASFTFNICVGFGVASTIMIGNHLGVRDFEGVRKVGINNLKIALLLMASCGVLFIVGRNLIPYFFVQNGDLAVIKLASTLLMIAALFQLSDGIQVVSVGALRGIQDVKIPSFVTFVAYWIVALPLGWYLCYERQMGAVGMWIALGLGLTFVAIFLIGRFLRLTSRKIELENRF